MEAVHNIKAECEQYDKQFGSQNKDAFYVSDFVQVKNILLDKIGNSRSINLILYETIDTALKAGFMIGYKASRAAINISDQDSATLPAIG